MNKNKKTVFLFTLFFALLVIPRLSAQCGMVNTAFKSGEKISYDLYFKYGILNARAGKGSLSITEANYKGERAYKTHMLLNTSGLAGSVYTVNDTLTSFVDMNVRPLLFTKEAFEGSDYSTEKQAYSYNKNTISVRAIRTWNGKPDFDEVVTTDKCAYDYLSVLLYVRNIDFSGMKKGDRKSIHFLSGKNIVTMYVNYLGNATVKANDGKRYEVINLSMTIFDKAFPDQREAIRASLTNDQNRIPVIIDTVLKIGSVRAVLKSVSGERHP